MPQIAGLQTAGSEAGTGAGMNTKLEHKKRQPWSEPLAHLAKPSFSNWRANISQENKQSDIPASPQHHLPTLNDLGLKKFKPVLISFYLRTRELVLQHPEPPILQVSTSCSKKFYSLRSCATSRLLWFALYFPPATFI